MPYFHLDLQFAILQQLPYVDPCECICCRGELGCADAFCSKRQSRFQGVAHLPGVAGTSKSVQLLCQAAPWCLLYPWLFLKFFLNTWTSPRPLTRCYSLPPPLEESHGWRSLTGCVIHGVTKSTTGQLTFQRTFHPNWQAYRPEKFLKILSKFCTERIKASDLTKHKHLMFWNISSCLQAHSLLRWPGSFSWLFCFVLSSINISL